MRKERVVVSALGRWESAKKKTREETIVERARASLAELVETPLRCAPKTFRLPRLCSQEERAPNEKEKMASESSAWGRLRPNARRPPPHRSLRRTTTLPEIVSAFRDRGRIDPHQSHLVQGARFFFFSALDTTKENALIQHISSRGESMAPPFCDRCANVGNRRAESVRVAFVFRSAKKRTIFLFFLFFFFCCCCSTLWRVLNAFCVALQMRDFLGGEEVRKGDVLKP